jgi:2-polyprenyl-6-methoxyphenol hydroxylase-like FAD-dependent oxidoreductase
MPYTVGIAGCGVAGLAAAVLLAREGHRVTIHEQSPELGPVGAGVLLQPSGQEVLREMGLLEAVVADAERVERLTAFTHRGNTLVDLPYGELAAGACAYGLQRGELFVVLYKAAIEAGAAVRTGQRIVRYGTAAGGVYFEDAGGARHGAYDFVLAADGARSVLRENAPIASRVHAYPHGALWAVGPCGNVSGRLHQVCRGTRELCGVLPMGRGRASLFWSVRNDEKEALRKRGFAAWRGEVLSLCPQAGEIFDSLNTFDAVQFVSYMHVRMPRPFDQNCLFLGDAAHAMSPHLGQGINLALIDAYVFAAALEACGGFGAACERFTRERAAHLRAYRIITYLLSPFFQSRGVIKGWGRDIALPLMPRIGPLRRQMIVTMAGCRRTLLGGLWALPPRRESRVSSEKFQAAR